MTKEQWSKIIGAVLVCVIAILGAFGYDVLVDQPREAGVIEQVQQAAGGGWLAEQPAVASRGVGYNTACYLEQGGSQITGDSGCTVQLNSGATLDMNAGTLRFEGATADAYETSVAVTDPTADRTLTLPNMSGTVLVTNTPKILAFGTNTVTNTLTLSHGITGPTQVFCTLTQDSAANAATCSATISSDTIVLKLWQADGASAGAVGKQIAWMVVGPGQ
jgi:hypothetical protein